jgi:nitrilase
MKVALIQMNSRGRKADNLKQAVDLIEAAVGADKPDLIVLPEMFTCLSNNDEVRRAAAERMPDGEAWSLMSGLAARHEVTIHAGSILESEGRRIYNTSCAFDRMGREIAKYRKIHLFDVVTPDGMTYRESDTFSAGQDIVTYDADGHRFGASICYDLRFPELYQELARQDAEVIFVPAAFTYQTGKDHWDILLRARAIETQSFVLAAAQCGSYSGGKRTSYGRSMVCDPWGRVLAQAGTEPGFITAVLDFDLVREVRAKIPLRQHKVISREGRVPAQAAQ